MSLTFALRRFDEARLREALSALTCARARGDPEPLFPWLETWRIDGLLGERPCLSEDFLALFERCAVGREIDLLDRTPAGLAGRGADDDLRGALATLEAGAGLEPWMRGTPGGDDGARDGVLGLLGAEDVARLAARVAQLAPDVLLDDGEERATYAAAWQRARRAFAVAAERREGLALAFRA